MGIQKNDVRVTIRIDKDLKEKADVLFSRLGLNMTTALNVFLRKAVNESAIPFAVSERNTPFSMGFSAKNIENTFRATVQSEIDENKQNGFPIARYDANKRQAYLESPDGTREYINE